MRVTHLTPFDNSPSVYLAESCGWLVSIIITVILQVAFAIVCQSSCQQYHKLNLWLYMLTLINYSDYLLESAQFLNNNFKCDTTNADNTVSSRLKKQIKCLATKPIDNGQILQVTHVRLGHTNHWIIMSTCQRLVVAKARLTCMIHYNAHQVQKHKQSL